MSFIFLTYLCPSGYVESLYFFMDSGLYYYCSSQLMREGKKLNKYYKMKLGYKPNLEKSNFNFRISNFVQYAISDIKTVKGNPFWISLYFNKLPYFVKPISITE